jgi:hypothetical protein
MLTSDRPFWPFPLSYPGIWVLVDAGRPGTPLKCQRESSIKLEPEGRQATLVALSHEHSGTGAV